VNSDWRTEEWKGHESSRQKPRASIPITETLFPPHCQNHQAWSSAYMATARGLNQAANPSKSTLSKSMTTSSLVTFVVRRER